jgi:hypothetical protein
MVFFFEVKGERAHCKSCKASYSLKTTAPLHYHMKNAHDDGDLAQPGMKSFFVPTLALKGVKKAEDELGLCCPKSKSPLKMQSQAWQ